MKWMRTAFLHRALFVRQRYPTLVVLLFPNSGRTALPLAKQPFKKRLAAYLKMPGHIGENGREGADAKRGMLGDARHARRW